jgi:uncharacterized protein
LMAEMVRQAAAAMPVVVLIGARQVGKTTLFRQVFPEASVVTFDPHLETGNARREPDLFLASQPRPLLLDEIQYAPELVAAVKRAIDRDRRPGQFLITGSQQWQVMARLAESLAGRAIILELEGFSAVELARQEHGWLGRWLDAPDQPPLTALPSRCPFAEQIWRGFLPEAQELSLTLLPLFQQSYRSTYIERDVRLLAELADWNLFSRFTRLVSALTAQEVNRNELGRELGISPPTASAWLGMLVATCQWHEVPPWHGSTVKRLSRKNKGYAADSGQVCSALAIPTPAALLDHPAFGAIVESTLVGELRRQGHALPTRPVLHHWRAHGGAEVDLLVEYAGRLHPIEIKASTHPGSSDCRGILAFRATYPQHAQHAGLILAPVERGYQVAERIWVVPWNAAG